MTKRQRESQKRAKKNIAKKRGTRPRRKLSTAKLSTKGLLPPSELAGEAISTCFGLMIGSLMRPVIRESLKAKKPTSIDSAPATEVVQ